MCSICNQIVCPIACPNQVSQGLYTCKSCGEEITVGDTYYKLGASYFHKECLLDSYDANDILTLLGVFPRTARGLSLTCLVIGEKDGRQDK